MIPSYSVDGVHLTDPGYASLAQAAAAVVGAAAAVGLGVHHAIFSKLALLIAGFVAGGAELGLGSGLRGLSDRVASVDGRFVVSSPIGGPTVIRVELPCAS